MNGFSEYISRLSFPETAARIEAFSASDAASALSSTQLTPDQFAALLSPAAAPFLEEMAQSAQNITKKRFGNVIKIYAPMYLSNECKSNCTYCGFSHGNNIRRKTLSVKEAVQEARILHDQGIRHILLLTGEDYAKTPVRYIGEVARELSNSFASIGIEVYPLKTVDYEFLRECGVDSLAVYQETYDPVRYRQVHLRGMKKRMEYRLNCPDRAGEAGMRKIAVGSLLGLSDSAADVFFTGLHAHYIMRNYWRTEVSISLPRLRRAEGFENIPVIEDRVYVQYLSALRLFLPDAGINLSTRETARLRDNLVKICVTSMSAGSKTEPGGYSGSEATEQFQIEDSRSVAEIVSMLQEKGIEPVFNDWSSVLK